MKKRIILSISLVLASNYLLGCSDNSNNPVIENNLYFYTEDTNDPNSTYTEKLVAYDLKAGTSINVTELGSTLNLAYYAGNYDYSEPSVTNLKFDGVYYSENNSVYTAEEDSDGNLTTRQLSSLSVAVANCNYDNQYNYRYLFVTGIGVDGECNTADDTGAYYITPQMNESSQALTLSSIPITYTITPSYDIKSWIVFSNGELQLLNKDFSINTIIGTGFTSIDLLEENVDFTLLNIDGQIRRYNAATSRLSASLHTLAKNDGFVSTVLNDTTLYFEDDNKFYRLDNNGSSNSVLLATESLTSSIGYIITVIDNLILYSKSDTNSSRIDWMTLNITTGEIKSIVTTNGIRPQYIAEYKSRIYYNLKGAGLGKNFAGAININGTDRVEIVDNLWAGRFSPANRNLQTPSTSTLILNELTYDQFNSISGGALYSYNPATNIKNFMLGVIPVGTNSAYIRGIGSKGLGRLRRVDQSYDIFYINVNKAQSFRRVTNTKADVWTL